LISPRAYHEPMIRAAAILTLLLPLAACGSKEDAAPSDPAQAARLAEAKKLLAEAGFPGGKGLPKIEILYNTDEGHKKIAAALQQMWRKTLGVDVELRNTEWKVYLDDMSKLRYQIMRRGWIGDYRDPMTFIELMTSWSGNNNTGWANADYDALVKKAAAEPDPAKRLDFFRQAEAILMDELPILPLYFYVSQNAWKDTVKGLYANIQDTHPLHDVYVEGKDELVINNATEVQTLDPGLARGQPEHRVTLALFEGLTTYDPKTCDPRPGTAERWDVSPDGRTYTFHLRDASWSDGRKVVAQDFVYAWTRVLNPATPTDYAHLLYFIKGAESYHSKKAPDAASVAVKAKDDRTLVVELEHPTPFFPELCAFFVYAPVRKDVLEKHGAEWTRPENFVGNGPFRLKAWRTADSITVEKSPTYWNAAKVRQPRIKFLPIENRSTAWSLYKEGTIDFVTTLPLEQIEEIVKRPDYRGSTYLATYYYSFNTTDPALKDKRVRKALALAVDRDILTQKITKQGQKPAFHIVPPIFEAYKSPRLDVKD
jgi:ABC-type oligopeptide transport system substrate-binding subunit